MLIDCATTESRFEETWVDFTTRIDTAYVTLQSTIMATNETSKDRTKRATEVDGAFQSRQRVFHINMTISLATKSARNLHAYVISMAWRSPNRIRRQDGKPSVVC